MNKNYLAILIASILACIIAIWYTLQLDIPFLSVDFFVYCSALSGFLTSVFVPFVGLVATLRGRINMNKRAKIASILKLVTLTALNAQLKPSWHYIRYYTVSPVKAIKPGYTIHYITNLCFTHTGLNTQELTEKVNQIIENSKLTQPLE